jgi:hypothetical protein
MGVGRPKLDRRKAECREVEMECDLCVRRSAYHVAQLTPDATSSQLKLFFGIMYPAENCRPMLPAFIMEARTDVPAPRRRPASVGHLAVAAVA